MKIDTLADKVLRCLQKYPDTRNSDMLLTRAVWFEFYPSLGFQHNGKLSHYDEDLMKLPREDNVKRIRAKIQNDSHLLLPTSLSVIKRRKLNEKEWYRKMKNPTLF